jgi:hypothetical protein
MYIAIHYLIDCFKFFKTNQTELNKQLFIVLIYFISFCQLKCILYLYIQNYHYAC